MSQTKLYIQKLLSGNQVAITQKNEELFKEFIEDNAITTAANLIIENQKKIMEKWKIKESIYNILQAALQIPNGTVDKLYAYHFDFTNAYSDEIIFFEIVGLEEIGLQYDTEGELISGTPIVSGDFKISLNFKVKGQTEDEPINQKIFNLIINPNPKSLWKNIPSDKDDKYWKEDEITQQSILGDKNILVASKRGRSHANVGSFRDDDYSFNYFKNTGWSVIAVADGAGSASYSRKGSQIACHEVINYFETFFTNEVSMQLDALLMSYMTLTEDSKDAVQVQISKFIYNQLGGCAKYVHNKLEEFATLKELQLKDLHSTLIFALFKKYDFGYVVLSFGVGDCPIAVINKEGTDFKLMNWLDTGDYGGGTRFITMPEIFTNENFATRFGFKIIEDFSFLFLMTDGIYDAKFVVEANLENLEKWKEFIADLKGENEDKIAIHFDPTNDKIESQLSKWMDFWSPGNHDDRTLAIVF